MKSLSSIGLGLSIVFGCLLLALVGELYYLLWWKRRFTNRRMTTGRDGLSSPAKELFYMFCLKKPPSSSSSSNQELCSSVRITDALVVNNNEVHQGKEFVFKPFGGDHESSSDDVVEGELMMLSNNSNNSLSGPPRFLFTIVEETREDLESEESKSRAGGGGKGSRGRSLSDLLLTVETPYLTPLASPPFFTPPLTPTVDPISNDQNGGALFSHGELERSAEAEFNKIRSSPPPKFKFLQDAEEKLCRRRRLEELDDDDKGKLQIMKRVQRNQKMMAESSKLDLGQGEEVVDGSFITIIVDKYREREVSSSSSSSSISQVLPLPSSPSSSSSKGKAPFLS